MTMFMNYESPKDLFVLSINCSFVLRFQRLVAPDHEGSLSTFSGVESQAAKRQKLDGGLLRKVYKLFFSSFSNLLILNSLHEHLDIFQ